MKKKRARLIAMISFTILLCVCMVQIPSGFISAADSSYTTMGGVSVGDRLGDGASIPWPSVEGKTVLNSYVYVYQDAWGISNTLFRSYMQEKGQAFAMPSFEELKGSYWLYLPNGETLSHWEVTGMTADVSGETVTFFWHIKLIRQRTGENDAPGTSEAPDTETPGTSETPGTETGGNNTPGAGETPGTETGGDKTPGTDSGTNGIPGVQDPAKQPDNGTAENPSQTGADTKITNAGTYDLTAGTTYILDGPVGVNSDISHYASGISFRVNANGSYTFR